MGRSEEYRILEEYVLSVQEKAPHLIPVVSGPVGIGKTALVLCLRSDIEQRGMPVVYLEAGRPDGLLPAISSPLDAAVRRTLGRRPGNLTKRLQGLLTQLQVSVSPTIGIAVSLAPDNSRYTQPSASTLRQIGSLGDLVTEVYELTELPTVIIVDEVGIATSADAEILRALRRLTLENHVPVGVILVGNRIPALAHSGTVDPRSTRQLRLSPLTKDSLVELVRPPVEELDGRWHDEALSFLAGHCSGNPWLAREITNAAWQVCDNQTIDVRTVRHAIETLRAALAKGLHALHWSSASDLSRQHLLNLVKSSSTADDLWLQKYLARARMDRASQEALWGLLETETIDLSGNFVEYLVPWFDDYIREMLEATDD